MRQTLSAHWLFTGSKEAGVSAAVLFSLICSADRHGLNPQVYLEDLICKMRGLGENPTDTQLERFLPDHWQAPAAPAGPADTASNAPLPTLPGASRDRPDAD